MKKHWFLVFGFIVLAVAITDCQLFTSHSNASLPFEMPVSPLSEEQIASVKGCDIERLASEHYADAGEQDDLQSFYAPESECDWAVLAYAYAQRLDYEELLPGSALDAFSEAVSPNYGYALTTPLFYRYFGSISLAESPAFTRQDITDVQIQYNWSGYGEQVEYILKIHQANSTPTLTVTPHALTATLNEDINTELVQALSLVLTDLLPVESQFDLIVCVDNYPSWNVTLTFADDTTLNLTTASNFLFFGGPWFTKIDGQDYLQYSADFADALSALVVDIGLPIGQPAGMYCFGGEVFELAFP